MKKTLALLLSLVMVLSAFAGCGQKAPTDTQPPAQPQVSEAPTEAPATAAAAQDRDFTDSCGRTVKVPVEVTKIAISGPLSQIYILPLAGDMLVGVSQSFSADAKKYLPPEIFEKTEIGQLYGGKGEMDLEALLAADPDVVIDIGEAKKTIVEDMDSLSSQTGIPFVHIDATVATAPDAYRLLGQLVGREERGEELASYLQGILDDIHTMMEKVDADGARKSILYCLGDAGVNVIAQGSFHAETINTMADNLAVLEDVVSKGTGNEVDLEQILSWNPDVIVFAPESIYESVGTMEAWQSLDAIANGNYYEAPASPYGWLSSPPSVQRYLGLLWLGQLLYPEYVTYDLEQSIKEYYDIFYGCDLTDEMYQELTRNALPK